MINNRSIFYKKITLNIPQKNTSKKITKSEPAKTIIVTKRKELAKTTLFNKKLKKVNNLLSKSSFLPG
jgi:hypothetical protein